MTTTQEKNRQYTTKWRESHKDQYLAKQREYTYAWRERNKDEYLAQKALTSRISYMSKKTGASKEWLKASFELMHILI